MEKRIHKCPYCGHESPSLEQLVYSHFKTCHVKINNNKKKSVKDV